MFQKAHSDARSAPTRIVETQVMRGRRPQNVDTRGLCGFAQSGQSDESSATVRDFLRATLHLGVEGPRRVLLDEPRQLVLRQIRTLRQLRSRCDWNSMKEIFPWLSLLASLKMDSSAESQRWYITLARPTERMIIFVVLVGAYRLRERFLVIPLPPGLKNACAVESLTHARCIPGFLPGAD
jgi:hypothetical protein